jgi:arginine deiminase
MARHLGGTVVSFDVRSEMGRLRQIIVHRPGLELSRLTPRNVGEEGELGRGRDGPRCMTCPIDRDAA